MHIRNGICFQTKIERKKWCRPRCSARKWWRWTVKVNIFEYRWTAYISRSYRYIHRGLSKKNAEDLSTRWIRPSLSLSLSLGVTWDFLNVEFLHRNAVWPRELWNDVWEMFSNFSRFHEFAATRKIVGYLVKTGVFCESLDNLCFFYYTRTFRKNETSYLHVTISRIIW